MILAAAAWAAAVPLPVWAQASPPPKDIDAFVASAMSKFGAPGLSLAVVQDGAVIAEKGYGVRRAGGGGRADAHTAFPIGSETKAFTAAALAILVDRRQLRWTDRVVDRLPGFQMFDPYVTAHMTVRDLLTHRSGLGLGEGDLLIVPGTTRSRADILNALRYLKPATGFRETFAYDNILYIVAGSLVESVSGESWERFVADNIFRPVGMTDAHANYEATADNAVGLHARATGVVRGAGPLREIPEPPGFRTVAPAGGISASASDMARWMNVLLAHGALPSGGRLLSVAQAAELWKPVSVVPPEEYTLPAALSPMQPQLQSYALGWFVESYRGHLVIEHSGAVFGALAMLYLIPERGVGISVAINSEDSGARRAVVGHLLDHYLDLPPTDWISRLEALRAASLSVADEAAASKPLGAPNAPLVDYTGVYDDPWYGSMSICLRRDGGLQVSFDRTPGMVGALEPLGGEAFRTRWRDRTIEDARLEFGPQDGRSRSVAMKALSPTADFSFDYQDLHFTRRSDATGRAAPSRPCCGSTDYRHVSRCN